MDHVIIEGLRTDTVIGVHDWEREIRQEVVVEDHQDTRFMVRSIGRVS